MNEADRNLICEHHHFSSRHCEMIASALVERAHIVRPKFTKPMTDEENQKAGAELAHLIAHLHILCGIQVEATSALVHAFYHREEKPLIHSLLTYRGEHIHQDLQELINSPDPVMALFRYGDDATTSTSAEVIMLFKALLQRLKNRLEKGNTAHHAYIKSKHGLLLFQNPEILPRTKVAPDLEHTQFESDGVFIALKEVDGEIHYARIPFVDEQTCHPMEDELLGDIQEMAEIGRVIAQRIPLDGDQLK